jgi:hypothetical protein
MSEQKERPILFSGEMVEAILENRKTQTRRVVKPQPILKPARSIIIGETLEYSHIWHWEPTLNDHSLFTEAEGFCGGDFGRWRVAMCPYGEPGERLWCRETWFNNNGEGDQDPEQIFYRADGENGGADFEGETIEGDGGGWSQSNHMPRWASRILLEVVSVRVERLQAITEADARAEGIKYPTLFADEPCPSDEYARKSYAGLWSSINGKKPGCEWKLDPFVWVVEFKVLEVKGA